MKLISYLLILLMPCCTDANTINHDIDTLPWELRKEQSNIEVYIAKVTNSPYKAVSAVTTVEAKLNQLTSLIRDTNICSQWIYRCQHSYRYQSINDKEEYVYTVSNMPFPVENRDTLAHIQWQQDPDSLVITATGMATQDILSPKQGYVRIKDAKMVWKLIPIDDGKVIVKSFAHVNPGGGVPSWLSNRLSTNIPYKTLLGLRSIIKEYKNTSLDLFMEKQ